MNANETDSVKIEMLREQKSETCADILKTLPEWFGIPKAIDDYAQGAADLPMLVAKQKSGHIVGFMALKPQTASAVEAYVLGVKPEHHRKGYGHLLFAAAEIEALRMGACYLTVKTLADTNPDPYYRATRLFYESIGFLPLEVFPNLWGPDNPCLLMAKMLNCKSD